jgi:hypothetical protein
MLITQLSCNGGHCLPAYASQITTSWDLWLEAGGAVRSCHMRRVSESRPLPLIPAVS